MKLLLTIALISISLHLKAQENDPDLWYSFWDAETDLLGFKDRHGRVKIAPKFIGGFTRARVFDEIVAVAEQDEEERYSTYYLLKNGHKKAIDSVFFHDNSPDCESEGLVRFHARETDKVGFLDASGKVVIPANYDYALPFRNGLTVAIVGAEKMCFDGTPFSREKPCEHWRFEGSTNLLINEKNEVLVRDFEYKPELNLYSLQISEVKSDDPNRISFVGTNGKFYSFVDFEKEFSTWFECEFLSHPEAILNNSYEEISYFSKGKSEYIFTPKQDFLAKNGTLIADYFSAFKNEEPKHFIAIEGLNPYIFESKKYDSYFDNCGNAREWQYPLMTLVVSRNDEGCGSYYQDHIQFLKTKSGYKLIGLSLNSVKLRE